ncbi:MAG TPA: amino acid ABC transporter substrate-binding protein [Burkholderiales bacterium]|nr:amino acid ABC transporter substrate-binding protein [Burkholderiales bacterium]
MRQLLVLALLFAAPALAQPRLSVGAAMPQTGILADLAAEYRKALLLWQEQVNAGGGLLGRPVELILVDDRSESIDAGRLYEQLIRESKVDLLIGPFGSAATLGAAGVAERSRRVLVNATGASRRVQKPNFRYVFQTVAPLAAWGAGALAAARAEGLKRLALLARDDPGSREMASLAREQALAQGFTVGEVEVYAAGADDFTIPATRARAAGSEAWIAFGLPADAAEMVKAFRKLRYAPKLFAAQGAESGDFVKRVGQDAELALGMTAYDRRARTRGNAEFVRDFAAKWSAEPGALAAEGYAAAKVLEEAVRRAGSVDQEKLREALAALETETPLGAYKVDRAGAQLAAQPLLVQVQRGRREIVWPEALATAKRRPYPAWESRQLLK